MPEKYEEKLVKNEICDGRCCEKVVERGFRRITFYQFCP